MFRFLRTAVSKSCDENKKPPSPATDTTCVLGRTSAAEIAHGNATPSVCIPLLNNKCLGL
ncbi:Uncharacterised protein [Staphylococcus aureus]|nr:Uncharacterised protein [Staphylococcus aureus]